MASYDIFLSFEAKNLSIMSRLEKKLKSQFNLKIFSVTMNSQSVENTKLLIEKAINSSRVFICGMTKKYTETKECIEEILIANRKEMPSVAILLEPMIPQNFPGLAFISNWTCIKFYDDPKIESGILSGPNYDLLIDKLEFLLQRDLKSTQTSKDKKNGGCCTLI